MADSPESRRFRVTPLRGQVAVSDPEAASALVAGLALCNGMRPAPQVLRKDRQLAAGRSMCSTVYTGNVSSCRFSSRPSLPRTVKIVGSPANGFRAGVAFGGGGGSRMGV